MTSHVEVTYAGKDYLVCRTFYDIPETNVLFVVDAKNKHLLQSRWTYNRKTEYVRRHEGKDQSSLHQLICSVPSKKYSVDHISWCKRDDRDCNLRPITQSEQNRNRQGCERINTLPADGGLSVDDIPPHVYYAPSRGGKGENFEVKVSDAGTTKHLFWSSTSTIFTLRQKLQQVLEELPHIHAKHPDYFECFKEDFMQRQTALLEEFDAIVEEGVKVAGWDIHQFAASKHALKQRARYAPIEGVVAATFRHSKTEAEFELLDGGDERGAYGVMNKRGYLFLYDREDHEDVSKLNWTVAADGDSVKVTISNSQYNIERVGRLAKFSQRDVPMKDFLFHKHHAVQANHVVVLSNDNPCDMRRKNFEYLPGESRNYQSVKKPSSRVMQQIIDAGLSMIPKYVAVNKNGKSWMFTVKLPLPWGCKRHCITDQCARVKIEKLLHYLKVEYKKNGGNFEDDYAARLAVQNEFDMVMDMFSTGPRLV